MEDNVGIRLQCANQINDCLVLRLEIIGIIAALVDAQMNDDLAVLFSGKKASKCLLIKTAICSLQLQDAEYGFTGGIQILI